MAQQVDQGATLLSAMRVVAGKVEIFKIILKKIMYVLASITLAMILFSKKNCIGSENFTLIVYGEILCRVLSHFYILVYFFSN